MPRHFARAALLMGGLALAGNALAHPGHGGHGFSAGLLHPFALDHLLAVLAVGLWSVLALPAGRAWQGPALFLGVLLGTALLGYWGVMLPYLSLALPLSVLLLGGLLLLALTPWRVAPAVGLALVAAAAALHGLAHGFAAPGTGLGLYALGLVLATAALHGVGMAAAWGLQRCLSQVGQRWAWSGLGAAFLGTGGVLLLGKLATA